MATVDIKRDGTYHVLPDGRIHPFEQCAPDCRDRGGVLPWIAAGTTVDPEQILAEANETSPTRGQSAP